jgi:hypothetical protein
LGWEYIWRPGWWALAGWPLKAGRAVLAQRADFSAQARHAPSCRASTDPQEAGRDELVLGQDSGLPCGLPRRGLSVHEYLDAWRREPRPGAILTRRRRAGDMSKSGACGYDE